ncbi:hypothetical protein Y032_0021g359 [Ancylostoma ceylanicum]|uniref:Uncharacterized protein n=1 Tax=Ancylostoma ceylanicum TaxID=53326 RepID=A0A016V1S0_9BILA|nr:hypothetical protein Y032_0021g359 [Ancylostoma ceylanicum]
MVVTIWRKELLSDFNKIRLYEMEMNRYVGFGSSFVALAKEVCCGRKTVSDIVDEVALAIIKVLSSDAFTTPARKMFEECASKTRARYDYPRAEILQIFR